MRTPLIRSLNRSYVSYTRRFSTNVLGQVNLYQVRLLDRQEQEDILNGRHSNENGSYLALEDKKNGNGDPLNLAPFPLRIIHSETDLSETLPKHGQSIQCLVPKNVAKAMLSSMNRNAMKIEGGEKEEFLLSSSTISPDSFVGHGDYNDALASIQGHEQPQSENALTQTSIDLENVPSTSLQNALESWHKKTRNSRTSIESPEYLPGEGSLHSELASVSSTSRRGANNGAQNGKKGIEALTTEEHELFAAAELGDLEELKQCLLKASATIIHPYHGATPLHVFVAGLLSGNDDKKVAYDGIQILKTFGGDINARAGNGSTPLHWAAGAGNAATVRALLDAGATPYATTYTWRRQVFGKGSGQTPLHWACESNNLEVVDILTQHSMETVMSPDERGQNPLAIATKHGQRKIQRYLEEYADTEYVCVEILGYQSGMQPLKTASS